MSPTEPLLRALSAESALPLSSPSFLSSFFQPRLSPLSLSRRDAPRLVVRILSGARFSAIPLPLCCLLHVFNVGAERKDICAEIRYYPREDRFEFGNPCGVTPLASIAS